MIRFNGVYTNLMHLHENLKSIWLKDDNWKQYFKLESIELSSTQLISA